MRALTDWFMGGGLLGLFALIWRSNAVNDSAVKEVNKETDKKINRVYERLDEIKVTSDRKYVEKDLCKVIHQQTKESYNSVIEAIARLDAKIDMLRNEQTR